MKNKTFACVMGLVLALSLTACGEEEVIVENTNEEVSVAVQTQEATEAPTETVAETGTEAEGGPLLQVAVMEIPDLSGTEWNFAGGMIDGVEMEEEDLNATLETMAVPYSLYLVKTVQLPWYRAAEMQKVLMSIPMTTQLSR